MELWAFGVLGLGEGVWGLGLGVWGKTCRFSAGTAGLKYTLYTPLKGIWKGDIRHLTPLFSCSGNSGLRVRGSMQGLLNRGG